MPLLGSLIGALATAFASLFSTFFGYKVALKLAGYTAWLLVFTAYVASAFVCLTSLYALVGGLVSGVGGGGSSWWSLFFMGVGMFIPSNAGAVMSCIGSVWIGTSVYSFQRTAIHTYGS